MNDNNSEEYLAECRRALADEQAHSLARTDGWSHVDKPAVHREWDALYREMAPRVGHCAPDSAEMQSFMARHHAIVSKFYAPSAHAYVGMSLFYRENAEMKAFHDAYHPGLVGLLGEAMPVYASANLPAA